MRTGIRDTVAVRECQWDTGRPRHGSGGMERGSEKGMLYQVRASVSPTEISGYLDWNKSYGSFPMEEEDAASSQPALS
eukprot:2599804-Rhodomonas_salina.2